MFAGALREELFSLAPVIRRIQDEFIPVAISVPHFLGDGDEARFYRSLTYQAVPPTSGAPVPQGVCVVTPRGRVIAWTQRFDGEAGVAHFLDDGLAGWRREPDAAGPLATPSRHAAGEACPGAPQPRNGALAGVVLGRALDAHGVPLPAHGAQRATIEEKVQLSPEEAAVLAACARSATTGRRLPLPDSMVRHILKEMHLGQKDLALLGNPLGAPENVTQLALAVTAGYRPGVARLEGVLDVRVARPGLFEHAQRLALEGLVELDTAGVVGLVLAGRGTVDLRWHGFTREADRLANLTAGRDVEQRGPVRFGLTLERVRGGVEPRPEDGPSPVESARQMLGMIGGGCVDVTRWRVQIALLEVDWFEVRAGLATPEQTESFRTRMEALLTTLAHAAGGRARAHEQGQSANCLSDCLKAR